MQGPWARGTTRGVHGMRTSLWFTVAAAALIAGASLATAQNNRSGESGGSSATEQHSGAPGATKMQGATDEHKGSKASERGGEDSGKSSAQRSGTDRNESTGRAEER